MRRKLGIWAGLLVLLMAAACAPAIQPTPAPPTLTPSPSAPPTPTPTPAIVPRTLSTDPSSQAALRFVHAADDVAALDVYAELLAVATRLEPGQATSESPIAAGGYTFRIYSEGASADAEPLLQATLNLAGATRYTMLIGGTAADLTLTALPDDSSLLAEGKSRLLVINAAANSPPLTFELPGLAGTLDNLAFAASSPPVTVDPIRADAIITAQGSSPLTYPLDLRAGYSYTLVIMRDQDDPSGLRGVIYDVQIPTQAQIRFVHGLNIDVRGIDVYVDDRQIATGLLYGSATELISLPARPTALRVLPAGASADSFPLLATTIAPSSSQTLTLMATGDASSNRLLTHAEDTSPLAEREARITFVSLYRDAEQIFANSLEGFTDTPLNLTYAQTPSTVIASAGTQTLSWYAYNGEDAAPTLLFEDAPVFDAGVNYLYIVTGRQDAPVLVFSQAVGERVTVQIEETTTRVRFVNAIPDTSASFSLNGEPAAFRIAYAAASELSPVLPGEYVLTVDTGASTTGETTINLEGYTRYSLYAYGTAGDPRILLVEDDDVAFGSNTGRLRLVHVSTFGQRTLALGFADSPNPTINQDRAATPYPASGDAQPLSVPFGVRRLVGDTLPNRASLIGQLPTGRYDLFLIDQDTNSLVGLLPGFDLQDRDAFEIVVVYDDAGMNIFALPYPPSSG